MPTQIESCYFHSLDVTAKPEAHWTTQQICDSCGRYSLSTSGTYNGRGLHRGRDLPPPRPDRPITDLRSSGSIAAPSGGARGYRSPRRRGREWGGPEGTVELEHDTGNSPRP